MNKKVSLFLLLFFALTLLQKSFLASIQIASFQGQSLMSACSSSSTSFEPSALGGEHAESDSASADRTQGASETPDDTTDEDPQFITHYSIDILALEKNVKSDVDFQLKNINQKILRPINSLLS